MWWRPEPSSVSPIYMPGRFRTASNPLRTLIESAPYSSGDGTASAMRFYPCQVCDFIRFSCGNVTQSPQQIVVLCRSESPPQIKGLTGRANVQIVQNSSSFVRNSVGLELWLYRLYRTSLADRDEGRYEDQQNARYDICPAQCRR